MLYRLHRNGSETTLERVPDEALAYDPARRRVLMLPGGGVYLKMKNAEEFRRAVGGSIKMVEQALAPLSATSTPPVDIYLYVYEGDVQNAFGWMHKHFHQQEALAPEFEKDFGDDALLKLLLKPGESLRTLSKTEIIERIRSLTLVGHSMGSVLVQIGADYWVKQLKALGWSDADVADVAKELVTVAVASIARQDMPAPTSTQFFFTANNDTAAIEGVKRRGVNEAEQKQFLDVCGYAKLSDAEQDRLRGAGTNRYTLQTNLPDEITWTETRDGKTITRQLKNTPDTHPIAIVQHDFRGFLYGKPEVGKHLRNVLMNAVSRDAGIGDGHALVMQHSLNRPAPTKEAAVARAS